MSDYELSDYDDPELEAADQEAVDTEAVGTEYLETEVTALSEFDGTVSGNESPAPSDGIQDNPVLNEILETLNGTQNFGTIGDYYLQELGCYVFPNFEVYEYFIDIDAAGHEWAQASDGHYVQLQYLDVYEGYRTGNGEEEAAELTADVPDETDMEILEVLESIRGQLSVMKENDAAFHDEMQQFQTELLETEQAALTVSKGTLYAGIVGCILLAVLAGTFVSHVFFGRMRAG